MEEQNAREWQHIQNREQQQLFDILTGELYYPNRPFRSDQIEPDLIIKWRMPDANKQRYKPRADYKSINNFVNVPSPALERAFELAEKKIMSEMHRQQENQDNTQVKFRYMQSIDELKQPKSHATKVQMVTGGEEDLEINCFDEKNKRLDGFTLYINGIIYELQKVCGFKVRAFMVNTLQEDRQGILKVLDYVSFLERFDIKLGPKIKVRYLYLFCNLSIPNMLKIASRFQIKKPIDYSILDFGLNDPTTSDERPIKYHSRYRQDKQRRDEFKNLSRYFKIRQHNSINTDILDEDNLSLLEEQKFRSYWEQSYAVFQFLKSRIMEEISNQQKVYLYEYNRGKINPGCERVLATLRKRREYFELQKYICQKYEYEVHEDPDLYEQFVLSNKQAKGGFFQKLRNTLAYKANFVTPYGDMAMFNSMERTKLCYLMLKSTFKVNYLQSELNMEILSLNNAFEKQGEGGQNQKVRGGLDGTFLVDRWYIWGLFSDITIIRNYFGDVIAHEIMIKISVVTYLFAISVPYLLIFILEALYAGTFLLVAAQIKTAIFALSFSMYTLFIEQMEDHFVKAFSDNRPSKVFSNNFSGPYIRNILTDECNEFEDEKGFFVFLRNSACLLIFATLAVFFGAVFHGCRMFLVDIYNSFYHLQGRYFSVSHLFAYSIYLIIGDIFKLQLYGKVVNVMIWIKNPSSDVNQRYLRSYLTFYYLLVIQLIPIIFFFIIEPFAGTSCYSQSCQFEFYYYIYARFLFNIIVAGINFVQAVLILARQAKQKLARELLNEQKKEINTFQTKLRNLINSAIQEGNRSTYSHGLTQDILSLFAYCFYCTELPLAGLIAFGIVVATYIIVRIQLLYDNRRPINKSEPIIFFSSYCHVIYFVGGLVNIWVNTFLLGYVERHYHFIINAAPHPLTRQSIFLIKIFFTVMFFIILNILAYLSRKLALAMSPKGLVDRQHNKYKEYRNLVGGPKTTQNKIQNLIPTKVVFRTFNPKTTPQQQLQNKLEQMNLWAEAQQLAQEGMQKLGGLSALNMTGDLRGTNLKRAPGMVKRQSDLNNTQTRLNQQKL